MMKRFPGKNIIVAISVSVTVILGTYFFLFEPKQREITRLKQGIHRRYKEIEEIERMVSRVPNPKEEIDTIKERLQRLKEKATDREQIPRIMQQLFQKTSEFSIEVISINPRDDIKIPASSLPEGVSKVYFEIKIRCPYRTLVNYIDALNKLQILFTIEDMGVAKFQTQGVTENLDVMLLLSTYVMA